MTMATDTSHLGFVALFVRNLRVRIAFVVMGLATRLLSLTERVMPPDLRR
jgi:hypothetical protein